MMNWSNDLWLAWLGFAGMVVIHFLWQGVVIGAVYALLRLTTNSSSYRSGMAALAIATMLVMPAATFFLLEKPAVASSIGLVEIIAGQTGDDTGVTVITKMILPVEVMEIGSPASIPWKEIVGMVWLIGVLFFVGRLLLSVAGIQRLRWTACALESRELQAAFLRMTKLIGIKSRVVLLSHEGVQSPLTFGWLRPVVIVPMSALSGMPMDQVELIFAHELAHIYRRDYLINLMQTIAESCLFFHPVIWWISGELRKEREFACDDLVLKQKSDRISYAKALNYLEGNRQSQTTLLATAATNGGKRFLQRIERILGQKPSTRTRSAPAVVLFCLIALLAVAAGSIRAQNGDEELVPKKKEDGWSHEHVTGKEQRIAKQILTMPDDDLKLLAFAGLVKRWIETDTSAAWEFGKSLKTRDLVVTFRRATGDYLARERPLLMLEQIATGEWWPGQWPQFQDAMMLVADDDLDQAVKFCIESMPKRIRNTELIRQIAIRIVKRDGKDAGFAFAEKMKRSDEEYAGALQGTLQGWVKIDENAAIVYAEDFKEEKYMPYIVSGLLAGTDWFQDPQSGIEWVMNLGDDRLRHRTLANLVWFWQLHKRPEEIDRVVKSDLILGEDRQYLYEAMKRMDIMIPE